MWSSRHKFGFYRRASVETALRSRILVVDILRSAHLGMTPTCAWNSLQAFAYAMARGLCRIERVEA
jgi:hypothetical protein